MDVLGSISKVFDLKWDALFRVAASVLGVATVAGGLTNTTPLNAIAGVLEWSGVRASTIADAGHVWLDSRSTALEVCAVLMLAVGLLTTTWSGRGAALAVLGIAALAEANVVVLPMMAIVLFSLALAAAIASRWLPDTISDICHTAGGWLLSCIGQLCGAVFYIVVVPVAWIAGSPPRSVQW